MAKQCKIIHINDGTGRTLENGNFHYVEEFDWTEKYLQRYLRQGYEVKFMVPEVSPNVQSEGSYSFFKSGFTFYLERETDEELEDDQDDTLCDEDLAEDGMDDWADYEDDET